MHRLRTFNVFSRINWRSKTTLVVGIVILALAAGVGFRVLNGSDAAEAPAAKRQVKVSSVVNLMSGSGSLSTIAEIKSVNEAKISSEIGGRVVRVSASLGSAVGAGQVLAEMENGAQRAAVLQAEGAFDAAKAALQKVQGGTREQQLAILESADQSARSGAVNTLLSAYAAAESAVHDDVDATLSNPESSSPTYLVNSSQTQLATQLQNERTQFTEILKRQAARSQALKSTDDLAAELGKTEEELRALRSYLDVLIRSLNAGLPSRDFDTSDIATFLASAQAGRTAVTTSLSAIAASRAALEAADKNLDQGVEGAQSEDVAAAKAAVKSAEGTYNAALASLEKTIIRSPISGTLNNFTIKLGDFLAPAQEVAVVSNNGSLEGIAYVTEDDRQRISVGQKVKLEGDVEGTITKIAPALDPVTRRIEVRIGLPQSAMKTFTNGQSVRIELSGKVTPTPIATGPISIPITAIKIEANRTVVLTADNGIIAAHEVTIGKLAGDSVQVLSGLDPALEIVVDARGLKEGDSVDIAR